MAAPKIAGNMAQMDTLAREFSTAGDQVQDLMGFLTRVTTDTIGPGWEGASAQRFLASWTQEFKPALDKLNVALNNASGEVANRKQALTMADS